MMYPQIILNWTTMGAAFVASFIFGFLWYGPLFGKKWALVMGFDMSKKPEPGLMRRAFILQIVGLFFTIYVLEHMLQVWRPSVWSQGEDLSNFHYAFCGAVFTWIGFYVPMQFAKLSWEMRPWKLFFINAPYDFLNLLLISLILCSGH